MANPQCENGFTKLASEILDKFCCFRIPGETRLVIDSIIRKTYGFNKKEDKIANSQLIEMTGLKKGNVSRALSEAITHRIVIKNDKKLSLNKNHDEWLSFQRTVIKSDTKVIQLDTKVIQLDTKVIKNDNKKLSKARDTIDSIDNIQKTITIYKAIPSPINKELQDLIDFSKERQFSLQGSVKQNRQYAYNLLRKKDDKGVALGLERVKWLVEVALKCRGVPYAPQVNDFKSMFYKWQDLLSNAQKEKNERSKHQIG